MESGRVKSKRIQQHAAKEERFGLQSSLFEFKIAVLFFQDFTRHFLFRVIGFHSFRLLTAQYKVEHKILLIGTIFFI